MLELISKHPIFAALALCAGCAAIAAFPVASFAAIMLGWTMLRTPKANVFNGKLAIARAPSLSDAAYEGLCAAFVAVVGFNSLIAWLTQGGCFPARCL